MSTKECILDEALTLFSESGYDGTGVDLIAERVGIKGPSLYKHFKGKEEILNALLDNADLRYEEYFGSEAHIGMLPGDTEEFVQLAMSTFSLVLHDPMIRKTRKLLVREQFRNERLAEMTTRDELDGLRGLFTKLLESMMNKGKIEKDDPAMLAMELTAPAVLLLARAARQPECEDEVMDTLEKHVRHFCEVYIESPKYGPMCAMCMWRPKR